MFTLLFDTGMRRGELTGITLEDLNLDEQIVFVTGKGRKERWIAFGRQTTRVLDRYLRIRATHRLADNVHLFIGLAGPITGNGLRQILTYRAKQTGIPELATIHPHLFRHTYAHLFLEAGGQESDLMEQSGWKSPAMARHYGAALRAKRAREVAKRLSPGDRLGQ